MKFQRWGWKLAALGCAALDLHTPLFKFLLFGDLPSFKNLLFRSSFYSGVTITALAPATDLA
jgi:hypothetical protein